MMGSQAGGFIPRRRHEQTVNLSKRQAATVLVTGSNGRIGRVLMQGLAARFALVGLDRATPASPGAHVQADITDLAALEAALAPRPSLTHVVHLAGDPRVDAPWASVRRNNIHGTRNVYEAARRHGRIRRIVFASSNHVTGFYEGDPPALCTAAERPPLTPDAPPRPDSNYGISKLAGEAIARYYFDYHGIESVCLRIGSVTAAPGLPQEPRHLCTWLSYGDLVQLVTRSLLADATFRGYGIYYGVSANARRFWSIANAKTELGYEPQDNAADFWPPEGE